jgi:hypothetical protein
MGATAFCLFARRASKGRAAMGGQSLPAPDGGWPLARASGEQNLHFVSGKKLHAHPVKPVFSCTGDGEIRTHGNHWDRNRLRFAAVTLRVKDPPPSAPDPETGTA